MTSDQGTAPMASHRIIIRPNGLKHDAVQALLREHVIHMAQISPPDSCHALEASELCSPDMTFWSAWQGENLAGCGALRELDRTHGEIKSMCTSAAFQRRGVAAQLLDTIIATARQRGYHRISLETGSMEAFFPARKLYIRFGFRDCPPFGDYVPDPNSRFMTLKLL